MEKFDDRFQYLPQWKKGDYTFDGLAIPTLDTFEILEEDGVERISAFMKELLEWRKTIFGTLDKEHYGFCFSQHIVDTKAKVVLTLHGIKDDDDLSWLSEKRGQSTYQISKDVIEEHQATSGRFTIMNSSLVEKDIGDRAFANRIKALNKISVQNHQNNLGEK